MVLNVDQAHLTVNGRIAEARELGPRIFNQLVAENVNIPVQIARTHLQAETVLTNDIGAQ